MSYPNTIVQQVIDLLDTNLSSLIKVEHYAGELFTLDDLEDLSKRAKQYNMVFVDLETLIPSEEDQHSRTQEHEIVLNIFCVATSARNPETATIDSYTLARECMDILSGTKIQGDSGVHNAPFVAPLAINKEFHGLQMSVHNLSVYMNVTYDSS